MLYLDAYRTLFFPKYNSENQPSSYKVMGQLWVTGLWSSSGAVALKLNLKHLCKCKQGDDRLYTNNSNSFLS